MKKILANDGFGKRVFAHLLDDGTIDFFREGHRVTVIGESFTLIGTNPQGTGKTVLQVVGGKLVEDDIKFKEEIKEDKVEEGEVKDGKTETPSTEPKND